MITFPFVLILGVFIAAAIGTIFAVWLMVAFALLAVRITLALAGAILGAVFRYPA